MGKLFDSLFGKGGYYVTDVEQPVPLQPVPEHAAVMKREAALLQPVPEHAAVMKREAAAPTTGWWDDEIAQIRLDEGTYTTGGLNKPGKHVSYLDTEKKLTGGWGHLLTPEEQKLYPEGTEIPKQVAHQWFKKDVETHRDIVDRLGLPDDMPDEAKRVLFNMAYNLGETKLKKFKKTLEAAKAKDWDKMADEMVDSAWYGQVGDRSKRLEKRIRDLATKTRADRVGM